MREAEIRRAVARPTENPGSYDLWLRALAVARNLSAASVAEAFGLIEQALALDPTFAAALASASRIRYLMILYGWSDDPDRQRREALELGARSLRLGGDDANVIANFALMTAYLEHDVDRAIDLVDRALALNSGSSLTWAASGAIRVLTPNVDLAVEHLDASMRLDPTGPDRPTRLIFLAIARFQQRRFAEAITTALELGQHTDNPTAIAVLAAAYGHLGQTDAARAALARYRSMVPQPIDVFGRAVWPLADHQTLFLEGIALAQGKRPSDGAAGAQR